MFAESEVQERRADEPDSGVQQNQLFDKSAHKVSTLSSLCATKSGSEQQKKKFPSATTTKGSQVLKRHMRMKQSSAKKASFHSSKKVLVSSVELMA